MSQRDNCATAKPKLRDPEALGTYVALLDSDDEREPSSLEQQVAFLEARPDVVAVGTGCQWCDEKLDRLNDRLYPLSDAEIRKRILRYSAFCIPSIMMRVDGSSSRCSTGAGARGGIDLAMRSG